MNDGVQHDYDPEAEAMRKIAFAIAVQFVDLSRDELQRQIKRQRWWNRVLIACVILNVGAALWNLL